MIDTQLITIQLAATNVNGWPTASVKLNGVLVFDGELADGATVDIPVTAEAMANELTITRYGKTINNMVLAADGSIVSDQILEVKALVWHDLALPSFLLDKFSSFAYNSVDELGSRVFGPNGVWSFKFNTPFTQWILDKKIEHEEQYRDSLEVKPQDMFLTRPYIQKIIEKIDSLQATLHEK